MIIYNKIDQLLCSFSLTLSLLFALSPNILTLPNFYSYNKYCNYPILFSIRIYTGHDLGRIFIMMTLFFACLKFLTLFYFYKILNKQKRKTIG